MEWTDLIDGLFLAIAWLCFLFMLYGLCLVLESTAPPPRDRPAKARGRPAAMAK